MKSLMPTILYVCTNFPRQKTICLFPTNIISFEPILSQIESNLEKDAIRMLRLIQFHRINTNIFIDSYIYNRVIFGCSHTTCITYMYTHTMCMIIPNPTNSKKKILNTNAIRLLCIAFALCTCFTIQQSDECNNKHYAVQLSNAMQLHPAYG